MAILAAVAVACIVVIIVATKVIAPNNHYNAAVQLMESGNYDGAIEAFEAMEGYKDSDEQIAACETALKDIDYDAAVELIEAGNYNEAIAAFEAMDGYRDSSEQIRSCETALKDEDYNAAVALMESGSYDEAIRAFEAMNGYRDSKVQIENIRKNPGYYAQCGIGDALYFGNYQGEEIKWRVLAKTGDAILVISEYGLDVQPYNTEKENVTWETCTLRTWLNDNFYNAAFSSEEQTMIQTTTVTADANPDSDVNPGNNTQDKVFLLSIEETDEYFSDDEDRMCVPTSYALSQGAYSTGGVDTYSWWLRSPGYFGYFAACINSDGWAKSSGDSVSWEGTCVRPAIWISLAS